jgi:hypothetical protein
MKIPTIIGRKQVFPDCYISTFEAGTEQQSHPKYAVQLLWPGNTPDGKPDIRTFCFSTN